MIDFIPKRLEEEAKVLARGDILVLEELKDIYVNRLAGNSIDMSLLLLKDRLRERGRGQISYDELKRAYEEKNYKTLIELFQERFLDFVSNVDIDVMYTYVKNLDDLKKLYDSASSKNRFIFSVMSL